jgi:pSer/pThr/pTyr-binding forkhead associated (FHA) protein/tetratricopeptide (TPR) repeat protein
MLKIIVRLHGQNVQTLDLDDPATVYWAGRNDNCQIPLKAENGISRQHFKVHLKEGLWHLEVVSRFNEILVGESSMRELTLKEGLAFSLPPYEFMIESDHTLSQQGGLAQAVGSDMSVNPMAVATADIGDKTVTRILDKTAQFVLLYREPEKRDEKIFMLTKDSYLVGRDAGCDIILDDARVSRRQFKISNNSGQFYLYDFQGVNGTYLNKNKITTKDPQTLKSGDSIAVLNHRFNFEIRDPEFESKMKKVQHLALVEPALPPGMMAGGAGHSELPVPMGTESYGALQPLMNQGIPLESPMHPSIPQEGAVAPPVGAPAVKVLNFWGLKIALTKENKMRIGIVAILLVAIIVGTSDDGGDYDGTQDVAERPADPFSKLTPEEQKQVKVQYELAKDLYTKGNYQLAKEELNKVHAKIPSFLDSEELARFIEVGIQSAQEREQQERLKREAAEMEERIQNLTALCRQQINPNTTTEEMETCLAPALELNPEHELIIKVREDVARIEEDRKAKEAEKALREAQIAQLKKEYQTAYDLGEKDPLKGIAAFKEFVKLTMPDPDKLLEKAKGDIKRLEKRIKSKVNSAIAAVRDLVETGKHKEAIIALEKASEVAPQDDSLREEIDRITEELRKKMQALYQEAILEENIGNIDTAKDRWQKILEQDIPNGEYHAKAKLKLSKYGGQ